MARSGTGGRRPCSPFTDPAQRQAEWLRHLGGSVRLSSLTLAFDETPCEGRASTLHARSRFGAPGSVTSGSTGTVRMFRRMRDESYRSRSRDSERRTTNCSGTRASLSVIAAVLAILAGGIATPASAAATPSQVTELSVFSRYGWHDTSVQLRPGQRYEVSWTGGSWTVDARSIPFVGPGGYKTPDDANIWQGCKTTQYAYGRLLGQISNGPVFSVGAGGTFTSEGAGELKFRIHDADNCLGDNEGSVQMQVST